MKDEIKFIEYNGIEGYIELMKHDVEPLNNPECKKIELYYDGKDIKAVLDYITNLQDTLKDREEYCYGLETQITNLQEENKRLEKVNKYIFKVKPKMYKSHNKPAIYILSDIEKIIGGDLNV